MIDIPKKFRQLKRFEQAVQVLFKHELGYILSKATVKSRKTEPETVRKIFEELGGSFVKLGQILSLRPDLIPVKYCEELSRLQDNVKPFPYEDAVKIIEQETGQKLKKTFSSFSKKPIASASIGQVHKARLRTGEDVAVKIMRRDIQKIMETDIEIMFFFAKIIKNHYGSDVFDAEEIVQAFKEYTESELNYLIEGQSIASFLKNFEGTSVKIPRPFLEHSSEKVLVLEYVEGQKLSEFIHENKNVESRKKIVDEIFNAFLKQVYIDGVFHADPHPGNILVLKGGEKKIALLDFGITGRIDAKVKADLVKLFLAMIDKDIDGITNSMAALHLLKDANEEVKKDMREMLGPYYGVSMDKVNLPKLFLQSINVAKKHKIKVPKDYVLLGKAIVTVESVCTVLDPKFNFVESAKPFITKIMTHEYSPRKFIGKGATKLMHAKSLAESVPGLISQYFREDEERNKRIEEMSQHLLRMEGRVDLMAQRFFLIVSATVLLVAGFLFGEYEPMFSGISIFSMIAFLMSFGMFFRIITMKL